ncbi:SulP family inorganic anion transporter [Curvibacter sp. APW13]|uniref:SLC26A/SulP transporter family protein n=1 Tax=Curvibacter sp. APW13 TaxID=3077236 RepID=UPI0028DFB94F|nr:SulP family inorganic anion transporter [Curvibacter sp. APW13]MDT8989887.1 SulP family inorganic anion transporter [Curvibacter sp. APW13]
MNVLSRIPPGLVGDFWGGLAAMLVALPSAIAFGVTIFSPLGGAYAAYGALAGILGVTALGLVAPAMGGTQRLITAPCAPAAAVLSAFAIEFMRTGATPQTVLFLLMAIGLLSGALQVLYGTIGLGRLIKYMPYPVVSGYLSGVGLIIIGSQLPKLLGVPGGQGFWQALVHVDGWQWQAIVVGLVTAGTMVGGPRLTQRVPAVILALGAGMLSYFGLGLIDPALLVVEGNALIVGPMGGGAGGSAGGFAEAFAGRLASVQGIDLAQLHSLLVPALTLSVLLSIDTLKTCVVLDAMTRTRHNSNRELVGQGLGNLASGLVGGIPGAGTMGATLVNMSSGAVSRLSGVMEGALALLAFLLLGRLIAWVPIAALAAILIVIGVRMIDRHSFALVKTRHTVLDFVVILAVVGVALFVGLIPASGTGIALAILLFIREQLGASIVRRKILGNQSFSKRTRPEDEMRILAAEGGQAVIIELQGSLFFGTTDQLYSVLEDEIKTRKYIVLDMRRVQTIDITAAHLLEQVRDMMSEKNGFLVYSHLPTRLPSGQNMQQYVNQTGLAPYKSAARVFDDIDEAKGWIENRILKEVAGRLNDVPAKEVEEAPLQLHEFELFKARKEDTLIELDALLVRASHAKGERIFSRGDPGGQLFLVRKGLVHFSIPLGSGQVRSLNMCGRGAFFGELTFLDGGTHSVDATAFSDVELFVLSRSAFDAFAEQHRKAALKLIEGLASTLTIRVRHLTGEVVALES